MLKIRPTSQFKKDLKTVKRQPKNKRGLVILSETIIPNLQRKLGLERKYCDHELVNFNPQKRECHLLSDLLLIYRQTNDDLILYRLGSHSDLF